MKYYLNKTQAEFIGNALDFYHNELYQRKPLGQSKEENILYRKTCSELADYLRNSGIEIKFIKGFKQKMEE